MDFTNREISSYLWLGIFLTFMLAWKPDVRRALAGVIEALAQRKLLILFGSTLIYMTLWLVVFAWIGMWTPANLKTTILWSVSFIFVTLLEVTSISDSLMERAFFTKLIRDIFAVTGILTFVIELHSFSLVVELIAVPLLAFTFLLHATAERTPNTGPVRMLLAVLLVAVSLWMFLYSLYMTYQDIPAVFTLDTLREFGVPVSLSLAFLPFLYVMLLLTTYENAFTRLRWQISDDKLRSRAEWEALLRFGPRLHLLRKWIAIVGGSRPGNLGELRRSFNETVIAAKREVVPPFIKPSEGWSPYRAKAFLAQHGLATGDYRRGPENEWWASSPYLELGDGISLHNNLAYYVTGTERIATSLKLKLNVNKPEECASAESRFIDIGRSLLQASLGPSAAEPAIRALCDLKPREVRLDEKTIRLTHEEWIGGIKGGYERSLELKHEG